MADIEERKSVRTDRPTYTNGSTTEVTTEEVKRPWYKRRWILIPFILLFGGALFLFLLDAVIMPFYVKSSSVAVVPNVVGMKSQAALDKLTEAGYEPTEYERRFDDKVAEGVVIRQTPESGEETKPGRAVYLVVSGGKEMAVVPDLMGKSLRDAKMQLLKSNLSIGDINFGYSEVAANGTIFQQAPTPGSKINTATKVNVVISQGPLYGRVPVPSLKGLTLSETIAMLNNNKLTLGNVTWETRPDGTPNTVIEQYPSPGDLIIEGSTVDVFVIRENAGSIDGAGEN
ncbi:MAG TPA: PASTA domain-containing protein [Candidatus Kapabacteria bacterium]|nr:PASTA domain-containing protein [Candidatus Kapabacteria bacterium]